MTTTYGATPQEWDQFSLVLGLTADLLPVVSNPNAKISPQSKMQKLGKTPSRYNSRGHVCGIKDWPQKIATSDEVRAWREIPDLGICIQTRLVRALDVDVDDPVLAADIHDRVSSTLGRPLPCRRRGGSSRFLLAFVMEGEYTKRIIHADQGAIEFLAGGQQFVAAGAHGSGERYAWDGGLPDDLPALAPEQFERLWGSLVGAYATDGTASTASLARRREQAVRGDPVAQALVDLGVVAATESDGRLHITCPFEAEHTAGGDVSATTYFPAHTSGYASGHFVCLHAHCAGRVDGDFLAALGLSCDAGEFEVTAPGGVVGGPASNKSKYVLAPWGEVLTAAPPSYHIQGVLPEAALVVIYGAPGSGKTFLALDLALSVARGEAWCGRKTKQGTVVYIAAEDAHGVRMRARAYAQTHGVESLPFFLLDAAPNFRSRDDVTQVAKSVAALGPVRLVIVDTWARVLAGDENSAQDVGEAVDLSARLHRATGATIVVIHHTGKDSTRGARGSTALLGACDCEIEVSRCGDDREAQVTKLKNGSDGERFGFRLSAVPIGTDDDGDIISSCVVEHVETRSPAIKREIRAREPRGVNEKIVLRAVDDLSVEGPASTADVVDSAVTHMPYDAGSGRRDQRRKSALVALRALIERGILTVEGDEIKRKDEQ